MAVSTITYYELGLQLWRQRIAGPSDLGEWRQRITSLGLREIPVSAEVAMRASGLGNLTDDPFDRVIVGTALVENAILLTADESLLDWPGQLRRHDASR